MNEEKKEEVVEDFYDEKPKNNKKEKNEKKEKSIFSRILNVVLWLVLFAWMILVLIDYFHVKNEEEPQFCWWAKKTTEYTDGIVKECTGLGYKVINYQRKSFKAIEFGPFWIDDRTAEDK